MVAVLSAVESGLCSREAYEHELAWRRRRSEDASKLEADIKKREEARERFEAEWVEEFAGAAPAPPAAPRARRRTALATIEEVTLTSPLGREIPGVRAECCESGEETESYGVGTGSIKRCLALLSQSCSCGAKWHEEADNG